MLPDIVQPLPFWTGEETSNARQRICAYTTLRKTKQSKTSSIRHEFCPTCLSVVAPYESEAARSFLWRVTRSLGSPETLLA